MESYFYHIKEQNQDNYLFGSLTTTFARALTSHMVLVDISPLKSPDFRRLYLSQLVSMLGSQMTMVTVPFQVYALTGSTFQTGLVSAVELVCLLSTALFGGVIADKFNRRRIIITAELAMMAVVVILGLNATFSSPNLLLIYVLAGVTSALNGFHRPAFEALTPQLVPQGDMSKVSSLLSFKFVAATLIGPSLGGFLCGTVGPVATYFVDASSFVISILLLLRITVVFADAKGERIAHSLIKEIGDGARYIYGRKDVLASYLVDFCAMVFCMPHVLFPALAHSYGMTKWQGFLYMSVAVGGLAATLLSKWTSGVKRLGVAISYSAGAWALSILCVGVIPWFWMLFAGFFLAGVADTYSGIFRMTMWNESISETYRGRIAAFAMVSYTSGPLLGNTVMGFLGDALGLHAALALGGALSLAAITLTTLFLREFRDYKSPSASQV